MKGEKLQKQITEIRIVLQSLCDGFDTKNANKSATLTMRHKVLFVLSENKQSPPATIISRLGIAKSNLALLCKSMLEEGVIEISKNESDKRNIYYSITEKGKQELKEYFVTVGSVLDDVITNDKECKMLERKFDEILDILKRKC